MIYLDDFWDWMVSAGKKAYDNVKRIYTDNKT